MKRFLSLMGVTVWLICTVSGVAFAQADVDLDFEYLYPDGQILIRYAQDWRITLNQTTGAVQLSFDEGGIDILPQPALEQLDLLGRRDDETDAVEAIAERLNPDGEYTEGFRDKNLSDQFSYLRYDYLLEYGDGGESENVIFAFDAGDYFVLVLGFGVIDGDIEDLEPLLYAVINGLEFDDFDRNTDFSDGLPTLDDASYDDVESILEVFEDADLITGDLETIAEDGMMSTSNASSDPWEDRSEYPNFIVNGLLSFRPDEDSPYCSVIGRITEDQEYFVAFDIMADTRYVRIREQGEGRQDYRDFYVFTGVDFTDPNWFTFVVRGDAATLYINGALMIENFPLQFATVEAVEEVGGDYGGAVALNLSCVITDYWMVGFEA